MNAVLAAGCWTLADVEARLIALAEIRPTENFEPLAASFKRIRNILKQAGYAGGLRILEGDFEQEVERQLYRELERVVKVATESGEYRVTLAATADTRPSVDRFFDEVMVMDKNPDVRARRLELLYRINTHFSTIADFSEIVTSGEQNNMKTYVYSFGGGKADGDGKMKGPPLLPSPPPPPPLPQEVLGGKGAGLAEMSRAGVPVPPGFTISTEVCNIFFQNQEGLRRSINKSSRRSTSSKSRSARSWAIRKSTAGQRPHRREVLDARNDEHHPEPRPQRQDRRRTGQTHRQSAFRLR